MNVIISNRYQVMLQDLNIDIIKNMSGEFDAQEIISTFQNFYFQRMILDITAIKNYKDIKTLQKLSISLDMDKVILLLDDAPESSSSDYLSKLISMGIYNFTKNIEGIMYLYNHPNSYRDVAHIHQLDVVAESVSTSPQIIQVQAPGVKIIGFKNVTEDAGSTSLIYMMKKQLEKKYKVIGLEADRRDFVFFNDKNMISVDSKDLGNMIAKYNQFDAILVDVNKSQTAESLCHTVFHLIEPSTIKLNKLMLINRKILNDLKGKKILLNKSLLSSKDVLDFEYEAKLKVFYNIPPLDEREKSIMAINKFLVRLGFGEQKPTSDDKRSKILGIF